MPWDNAFFLETHENHKNMGRTLKWKYVPNDLSEAFSYVWSRFFGGCVTGRPLTLVCLTLYTTPEKFTLSFLCSVYTNSAILECCWKAVISRIKSSYVDIKYLHKNCFLCGELTSHPSLNEPNHFRDRFSVSLIWSLPSEELAVIFVNSVSSAGHETTVIIDFSQRY